VVAVLASVATIVGVWVAWMSRNGPPAFTEWRDQANGVCDRWYEGYSQKSWAARDALAGALNHFQALQMQGMVGYAPDTPQYLQNASRATQTFAFAQRSLVGQLRGLKRPDERDGEIEAAMRHGERATDGLARIGGDLGRIDLLDPVGSGQLIQAAFGRMQSYQSVDLPQWKASLQKLQLRSCTTMLSTFAAP
jgi:hypothetical protein